MNPPSAPWFDLDPAAAPDLLGGFLICLLTLSIFSFLYRDNAFYKLAEHVFIGIGTAWYTMEFYDSGVLSPLYRYIADAMQNHAGANVPQPLGGYLISPAWAIGWRCGAVILSGMLLVRLVRRNAWISRWPLALMVGIYAALKMTGETQARLVQQIRETMVPLVPAEASAVTVAGHLVLVLGLVCVLAHFIFTFKRTRLLGGLSRVGIIVLMLAFGSRFGFTVLGRIALLIERVADLKSYSDAPYSLAQSGPAWMARAMTPPYLVAGLILVVLAITALSRRGRPAPPPTA